MSADPDVLVLCYHGVSPSWPAATTVAPAALAAQLRWLLDEGWRPATLRGALTAPGPGRTFAVTFDDAHRSVHELAFPAMDALGVPGTVFVPTDYAGTDRRMGWAGYDEWLGTEHEGELACMSWEALREVAARGWEIGSHTCSHPRLSAVADDDLRRELAESRAICEDRTGAACVSLAYPYSDYDDRVVDAARATGYGLAVTVPRSAAAPLPLQWPRVGVYQGDSVSRLRLRVGRRGHPALDAALRRAHRLLER